MPVAAATLVCVCASFGQPRQLYFPGDLEGCATHDNTWNFVQTALVHAGVLPAVFRRVWLHRVLQWSVDAKSGVAIATSLLQSLSFSGALYFNVA
jgi:hypothetical protein